MHDRILGRVQQRSRRRLCMLAEPPIEEIRSGCLARHLVDGRPRARSHSSLRDDAQFWPALQQVDCYCGAYAACATDDQHGWRRGLL